MDRISDLGTPTQEQVYIGIWTNWSRGKILGSTLTLSQRNGSFLIAFLALYVSFVGTCFWRIACYLLHQKLSSELAQDGLYHQRQAVLRNSASGANGLWSLYQILWHWRKKGQRPVHRILPLLLCAVLSVLAFATAGIFSSRIASLTGNEVLLSGLNCHILYKFDNATTSSIAMIYAPHLSERINSYESYVQGCYSSTSETQDCNHFVKPRLPSTIEPNATCPFGKGLCRADTGNIKLDSGYMDSHFDLGINAPSVKRMRIRYSLHCAPLATENHTQTYDYSDVDVRVRYKRYFYGPTIFTTPNGSSYVLREFTHERQEISASQMYSERAGDDAVGYDLGIVSASSFNGSIDLPHSGFKPLPDLTLHDGDISLVFLSAGKILYPQKVDDPWYAAHDPVFYFAQPRTLPVQAYRADEASAPMGCVSQYQVCSPSLGSPDRQCSPLGGQTESRSRQPFQNDEQHNMTKWLSFITGTYSLEEVLGTLAAASLTSKYSLLMGVQAPLSRNQWQLDVERWYNITLAAFQGSLVDTVLGPSNEAMKEFSLAPSDAVGNVGEHFCRNQKIRSTAYTNFTVFGLCVTLIAGAIIITIQWTLEPFTAWIQKRQNLDQYARLEWSINGTFQLQRLAHEQLGVGEWINCVDEVPVTEQTTRCLAIVDMSDRNHPRLKAPPQTFEAAAQQGIAEEQDTQVGETSHSITDDTSKAETIPTDRSLDGQLDHRVNDDDLAATDRGLLGEIDPDEMRYGGSASCITRDQISNDGFLRPDPDPRHIPNDASRI